MTGWRKTGQWRHWRGDSWRAAAAAARAFLESQLAEDAGVEWHLYVRPAAANTGARWEVAACPANPLVERRAGR